MKKFICALLLTCTLAQQANAGIFMLTGDIRTRNPTAAAIVTFVFLGWTLVGIVIDEESAVKSSEIQNLSEGGKETLDAIVQQKIKHLGPNQKVEVVLTDDEAHEVLAAEALSHTEYESIFVRLTTPNQAL